MNIRNVTVLTNNGKRTLNREELCRIYSDPPGRQFSIWLSRLSRWKQQLMSAVEARDWCREWHIPFDERWLQNDEK